MVSALVKGPGHAGPCGGGASSIKMSLLLLVAIVVHRESLSAIQRLNSCKSESKIGDLI